MVAPMIGRFHVRFGLWQVFWGVTSVFHIFHFLLACLVCMPALIQIGCSIADLQILAVAGWLQSFNSVREPMDRLGII